MPSSYVKCDGCGAVVDRLPVEIDPNDGTFNMHKHGWASRTFAWPDGVRKYAATLGWANPAENVDYCPSCAETNGFGKVIRIVVNPKSIRDTIPLV